MAQQIQGPIRRRALAGDNQELDYDQGREVRQNQPRPVNDRLSVEKKDEQPHDGQVALGRIIDESVAFHSQCSRVYQSKVWATPCWRPVSQAKPSSRRSFE